MRPHARDRVLRDTAVTSLSAGFIRQGAAPDAARLCSAVTTTARRCATRAPTAAAVEQPGNRARNTANRSAEQKEVCFVMAEEAADVALQKFP